MTGGQAQHICMYIANIGRWLETNLHMCLNIHEKHRHTAYKLTTYIYMLDVIKSSRKDWMA